MIVISSRLLWKLLNNLRMSRAVSHSTGGRQMMKHAQGHKAKHRFYGLQRCDVAL